VISYHYDYQTDRMIRWHNESIERKRQVEARAKAARRWIAKHGRRVKGLCTVRARGGVLWVVR
jgi:hypothetical protein